MSARPYWNDRADGRNVCGKGSTPVHLPLPLCVWKRLLAAGMLFCLGAQAAEKRNLDDIRNALWQDSDDVSLREMLAALGEAGEKNLSVTFAGVFCESCRRADADALEDLVRIFEAFPPESYQKGVLFTPLADAWLRVRISPKLPQRPVFPDAPTKLPEAPDGYPRELREAALEYERVRGPFLALQEGKVAGCRALTDLAAHAPVEALPLYFMALGKFVPSSAAPDPGERTGRYGRWGGKNLDGITARTASAAAQKQALDFLCSRASPGLPIEAATRLAKDSPLISALGGSGCRRGVRSVCVS